MDCHQQNQCCKNLPCFNLLTYETDTNSVCQQHQNSLWTEVSRCPHVGGFECVCKPQKHTRHTDVVQFVQMRKALLSSIKQNKGSRGPAAPTLDAQRERRETRGEEVNKIYHEHSQWSVKYVSHSSQKNFLLLVKWFDMMQSLIAELRNMIWID